MALQMKHDDDDDDEVVDGIPKVDGAVRIEELDDYNEEYNKGEGSKYHGGIGRGTVDPDRIKDLPPYTAPPVVDVKVGTNSSSKIISIIFKVLVVLVILAVLFALYKGIGYVTGSSGDDITAMLTHSEEELAREMKTTFEDNEKIVKMIPRYTNGTVTAKTGNELDIVYVNGKQVGVHTNGRKYRFFGVGVNDPAYTAENNMTYQYDSSFEVLTDYMNENSEAHFYYNEKNNDCLVLTVSKNTNRVVSMVYYTNYQKMTENLSPLEE